jgi:hypothetical protein
MKDAPNYDDLKTAASNARQALEVFRAQRLEAVRRFVGKWYGNQNQSDKVPQNMIELAMQIYSRILMPRIPECTCNATSKRLEAIATNLGLAINKTLKEIGFEETSKRFVLDALFSIGIIKVGYQPMDTVEIHGIAFDRGMPFADIVDLDDFVFDVSAKRWDQVQFIGNRYRVPINVLRNSEIYNFTEEMARRYARGDSDRFNNETGEPRIGNMTADTYALHDEFMDTIELWDIFLPYQQRMITLIAGSNGGIEDAELLRDVEWNGPERGPYITLGLTDVPGNLMPLAPVATWRDLHDAINILSNKVIRQAERRKGIGVLRGGQAEHAQKIMNAIDGDVVEVPNNVAIDEQFLGQIDPQSHALSISLRSEFIYNAGNLDALGGLAPQSQTATQDSLLAAAASVRPAEMQTRVVAAIKKTCEAIGWYLFHDPLVAIPINKRIEIPGMEPIEFETAFTADQIEGDFYEYNIEISVHSQQDNSPGAQLQRFERFLQLLYTALPAIQEQGIALNWTEIIKSYANLLGIKNVADFVSSDWIVPPNPIMPPERGAPKRADGPGKPAQTKRVYERISRTAGTRRGQDHVMAMQAIGGKLSAQQTAGAQKGIG